MCLDESMLTRLWRFRFARIFKNYFLKAIEHFSVLQSLVLTLEFSQPSSCLDEATVNTEKMLYRLSICQWARENLCISVVWKRSCHSVQILNRLSYLEHIFLVNLQITTSSSPTTEISREHMIHSYLTHVSCRHSWTIGSQLHCSSLFLDRNL